jgi:hypothetical protein
MHFDVQITESLLRRVLLRRLLRRWPLTLLAAVLIGIGVFIDMRSGRLRTVSVVGLTAITIQFLFYTSYYIRQRMSIADWRRLQGDAPVHYNLTPETLRATSCLGSTELRWNVFRELLEHTDYLLLSMGRSGYLTLPRRDVPEEALTFIRERFSSFNIPSKPI